MKYITGPANTKLLDRLIAENRETDRRLEEDARRQRFEVDYEAMRPGLHDFQKQVD